MLTVGFELLKKRLLLLQSRLGGTIAKVATGSSYSSRDNDVAATLCLLGSYYASENRVREAYVMYATALRSFDVKYEGTGAVDYGSVLLSNASACEWLGKTSTAIAVRKKLLEWQKGHQYASSQGNHIEVSLNLYVIGSLYKSMGQFDDARRYYHESLEIETRLFEMNLHSEAELVKALNNMGNMYYHMGNLEEALMFYSDSLKRSRHLYTSEHDDVARALYNCGNVQFLLMERERSLLSFQEALRIVYGLHGHSSIEAAKILNNIGNVLMSQEKFKRAAEAYSSSLTIKKCHYDGRFSLDVTKTMINLASAHISLGNSIEAMQVYNECLDYANASLPCDDPEVKRITDLTSQLECLEERRTAILQLFDQYIKERTNQRKTALGHSKQVKLNAALFVTEFVSSPLFRTLHHIKDLPGYTNHSSPLTHGSLGDLFMRCCDI